MKPRQGQRESITCWIKSGRGSGKGYWNLYMRYQSIFIIIYYTQQHLGNMFFYNIMKYHDYMNIFLPLVYELGIANFSIFYLKCYPTIAVQQWMGKTKKISLRRSIYGLSALAQNLLLYLEIFMYAQLNEAPCRSGLQIFSFKHILASYTDL